MATIWKLKLEAAEVQKIEVPFGAELLCAKEQGDDICVWFRCDPSEPKTTKTIAITATGAAAPEAWEGCYLGTAMLKGGALVFHVFERV